MTQEQIDKMFYFGPDMFPGEVIMSLIVMAVMITLSFVIYFKFRKLDPTKPEKGFALVVVAGIEKIEEFTVSTMGKKWRSFSGYALAAGLYIVLSTLVSLMGLPAPLTYLGNTLTLGICTFSLIHITAMKKNKLGYFKRYVEPIPVLLPINLLSMWAPLLSLSLRLFGNNLAGFTLMSIIYYFLGLASDALFGWLTASGASSILIAPVITPVLHLYFDLISGAIQTLIFVMLSMIFVSQEDPDEGDSEEFVK
jgi:F-type H+-transporting ATPase subunit a